MNSVILPCSDCLPGISEQLSHVGLSRARTLACNGDGIDGGIGGGVAGVCKRARGTARKLSKFGFSHTHPCEKERTCTFAAILLIPPQCDHEIIFFKAVSYRNEYLSALNMYWN